MTLEWPGEVGKVDGPGPWGGLKGKAQRVRLSCEQTGAPVFLSEELTQRDLCDCPHTMNAWPRGK